MRRSRRKPQQPLTEAALHKALLDVCKRARQRPRKKSQCPFVGVLVAVPNGERWNIVASASHNYEVKTSGLCLCTHAEETAISECRKALRKWATVPDGLTLFTSLEPCTERSGHQTSCSDRIVGVGIGRVIVGMLDPDPNIYGYGVRRLEENGVRVDYLPRTAREAIASVGANRRFIAQKEERFRLDDFARTLPRYVTEHDFEGYLRTAHALFRMYNGDRVVWWFPRLPSLAEKHRFQAWWAQGLFPNKSVTRVDVLVAEQHLKRAVIDATSPRDAGPPLIETVLEETREVEKVRVHTTNRPPHNQSRSLFLFLRDNQLEYMLDAARIREYSHPGGNRIIAYVVQRADDLELKPEVKKAVNRIRRLKGESLYDAIRSRRP
ncbi:MAG: hypothetical protein HY717_04345 [Planctomycetes bacterium]|nr:hypothetical protein [Planctomycetota bacterium]